jgi:putative addiction module component (TIGR02574 family)
MSVKILVREAKKLSANERWELVDELLRMGKNDRADVALTGVQAADLDRRVEEARAGKDRRIPGDEAVRILKKRK